MKRTMVATALLVVCVLAASLAFAQAPELRGTWKGQYAAATPEGFGGGEIAYVIKEQQGQLFSGVRLWFTNGNVLKRSAFRGVFDNGEISFAGFDGGYGSGYMTGKQAMTIKFLVGGSANTAMVCKLERIRFTTGFVEIDKDGNDVIMHAEIINHYPLNAERILKEADKNKDGKLTRKEWDAWKKANQ